MVNKIAIFVVVIAILIIIVAVVVTVVIKQKSVIQTNEPSPNTGESTTETSLPLTPVVFDPNTEVVTETLIVSDVELPETSTSIIVPI